MFLPTTPFLFLSVMIVVVPSNFAKGTAAAAPTIESTDAGEILLTADNVLFTGGVDADLAAMLEDIKSKATADSVAAAVEKGVAKVVEDVSTLSTRLSNSETKVLQAIQGSDDIKVSVQGMLDDVVTDVTEKNALHIDRIDADIKTIQSKQ